VEESYDQTGQVDQIDLVHESEVTAKRVQWLRILSDVIIVAVILLLILILLLWWDLGNVRNSQTGSEGRLPSANAEIADSAIGFDQLAPEIADYLKSAIANQLTVQGGSSTTVVVPTGPCLQGSNYFCQDGNLFGRAGELGTNDSNALRFRTTGITQAQINPDGTAFFQPASNATTGFQVRNNAATSVFDVDTSNLRVGINTTAPSTDLHVVGSERITGHAAIGPDATLGDSLLVTPLPAPYSSLMARRTQYVAEVITDISTAPPFPSAFVAQGNELLLDPTTDPSLISFGGAYSAVTTAAGNTMSYGEVLGQIDGVVLKGSGLVTSAFGTVSGIINLDGSTISNAVGHVVGTTNSDPTGVITKNIGVAVLPPNNSGTIAENVGMLIFDQAKKFGGTTAPVTGYNIVTEGAGLNKFGGSTFLSSENSAALTADYTSPYDATTRWTSTASNDLPTPLKLMGYGYANGYIYLTGGDDGTSTATSTVYFSKIGPNGTLSWATTTPLPAARSAHRTYIQNGYIYVVGGTDGVSLALSTVYYARLNADGTVGAWRTTASLPAVRAYFGGAQSNGYLYALAGTDGFSNFATVYYAKPSSDGSISAWTTSATPLPSAWKAADAVAANNYLYYLDLGGVSVRYASLNADGSNNAWSTSSTSPVYGTFNHTVFVNSGQLYRVGGNLTGVPQVISSTTPLQDDGDLGTWTEHDSDMSTGLEQHAAVATDGFVFLIGGSTDGSNTIDTVTVSSTRRVNVAGALDLVTLGTGSLSDGGAATTLTAGNTNVIGALQVYGDSSMRGSLTVLDYVNFAANAQLGGDVIFDQELTHTIKLADSTTAATAGAALSILGADGEATSPVVGGAIDIIAGDGGAGGTGGDINIKAGGGSAFLATSGGALNLSGGDGGGFLDLGGNVNITGGVAPLGIKGGDVVIDGGSGPGFGNVLLGTVGGNIGVGVVPTNKFDVDNGGASDTPASFTGTSGVCTVDTFALGWSCVSDEKLKTNILSIENGLEKVMALQGVTYNWKANMDGGAVAGFIAQDVEEVLPGLVTQLSDGTKSLNKDGIMPYLVEAVKQQQTQINELKSQLDAKSNVSVDVLAELAKAKAIILNGNLVVNGRVEFSAENKGTAKIVAGDTKFKVSFTSSFTSIPNVVISPQDFVDGPYRTTAIDKDSFTIELNKAQSGDVEFNWQAY
jgi:hypothetical protein